MENCKSAVTPLDPASKLKRPEESTPKESENNQFRELVGSPMYLDIGTRPDIAYVVNCLK